MRLVLAFLFAVACSNPAGPDHTGVGDYALRSVNGSAVPATLPDGLAVASGAIELRDGHQFLDKLSYTWMGLPTTDTLQGDWFIAGDSLVMIYFGMARVAAKFDGKGFSQTWGGSVYAYSR